jgi:hypothetical protein
MYKYYEVILVDPSHKAVSWLLRYHTSPNQRVPSRFVAIPRSTGSPDPCTSTARHAVSPRLANRIAGCARATAFTRLRDVLPGDEITRTSCFANRQSHNVPNWYISQPLPTPLQMNNALSSSSLLTIFSSSSIYVTFNKCGLDRHASLSGAQVITYRVSPNEKWPVLVGISRNTTNPAAFKVKGSMQLCSRDRGLSQPIEGHAASFAELKLDCAPAPTKLFTFSV